MNRIIQVFIVEDNRFSKCTTPIKKKNLDMSIDILKLKKKPK